MNIRRLSITNTRFEIFSLGSDIEGFDTGNKVQFSFASSPARSEIF